jgi:small subunit ribosomal protein S9
MQDEEQQSEEQQEGTPEEQQAEEQQAPEERPPAEGGTGERGETEPEAPEGEEALAEDAASEDDSQAEDAAAPADQAPAEQPAADAGEPKGDGKKKQEEVVPGAELDPIAIEPERELDAEERARREAEEEERRRRERELIGDVEEEEAAPVAAKPAKLSGDATYSATGKRKSSVARVILRPGSGSVEVNRRPLEDYFPRSYLQSVAKQPLTQTGYEGSVDVRVRVHGGGVSGQAAAVRHGIARALTEVDPALRPELKRRGMLSRDARVKERRKAGLKKARKRPQFSKR